MYSRKVYALMVHTFMFTRVPPPCNLNFVMKPVTVIEILEAAHLSKYVESPFPQRGGLFLVASPGALKSTMIEAALSEYPNSLPAADINVNTFMKLRDDLQSNKYATIAFGEFEKLYQRNANTAANIEGVIKACVEEGFVRGPFEDVRMGGVKARVLIIGGMTPTFYSSKYDSWIKSGFARRFLWSMFTVSNPEMILEAIHEWRRIEMDGIPRRFPGMKGIPFNVSDNESRYLMKLVREQPGDATPYVLLKKIFSVLRWKYPKELSRPMEIIKDFAESLSRNGSELTLPNEDSLRPKRKRKKRKAVKK